MGDWKTQYTSVTDPLWAPGWSWFSGCLQQRYEGSCRSSPSPEATGTGCCWEGKSPPQSPSPWSGPGLLSVREVEALSLLPAILIKSVTLPQLPVQMNRTDFYGMQDGEEAFFHICNLSQTPKAVPRNCFEIYSITFHNFSGNINQFEAAQRKREQITHVAALKVPHRVQVLIAEGCS